MTVLPGLGIELPSSWGMATLEDVTSKIGSGATPRGGSSVYVESGPALIRSQNVYDHEFKLGGLVFLTPDAAAALRGVTVETDDVLINITGDSILRVCLVPETVLPARVNQHVAIVRSNGRVDPGFLQKWLSLPLMKEYMLGHSAGGTRKAVTKAHLQSFPIPLPPIDEQRAIAATLGALDDKIESNRRALSLTQDASAAIFSRWRSARSVVEWTTFGDYADVYGGSTPKTKVPEYWGGDNAWATPTDVTGLAAPYLFETSRSITDAGLQSCTATMHPVGTIFMTSRATIGAFALNQVPAATNQGFIAVRPKQDRDRYFLLEEMRARVDEFRNNANGSTFLEISRGRFKELPLAAPQPEAIAQLDRELRPLHSKAVQLAVESDRLTNLRDTLLPQLLAGRIRTCAEAS